MPLDEIRRLHAQGLSDSQIARTIGRHQPTVSSACRRLGLASRGVGRPAHDEGAAVRPTDSAAMRARIGRLHDAGLSDGEIAAATGYSQPYVSQLRRELGLAVAPSAAMRWAKSVRDLIEGGLDDAAIAARLRTDAGRVGALRRELRAAWADRDVRAGVAPRVAPPAPPRASENPPPPARIGRPDVPEVASPPPVAAVAEDPTVRILREDTEEARALHRAGRDAAWIADWLGWDEDRVRRAIDVAPVADAAASGGRPSVRREPRAAPARTDRDGSTWTEARDAMLRELWSDGHPTEEIASRIGVTKNAVIGRAHRIGLSRPSPIRARERPSAPSEAAPQAVAKTVARVSKPAPVRAAPRSSGPCLHVEGEGRRARFCDAPAAPGSKWCETHRALCVVRVVRMLRSPARSAEVTDAQRARWLRE